MPQVQRAVASFFGTEPLTNLNPDEVVALGAAIQAKYISHDTGELTEQPDHNNIPNQLVSGITFVNNDFVNFASSLLAATMVLLFVQLQ